MRDNDWGISNYPLVLGHEGVGIVRKMGSSVKTLKVGDRVGLTWIRDSCQCCDPCLAGRENICDEGYQGTYLGSAAGCWGKNPHNEHGGCFSKVSCIPFICCSCFIASSHCFLLNNKQPVHCFAQ